MRPIRDFLNIVKSLFEAPMAADYWIDSDGRPHPNYRVPSGEETRLLDNGWVYFGPQPDGSIQIRRNNMRASGRAQHTARQLLRRHEAERGGVMERRRR